MTAGQSPAQLQVSANQAGNQHQQQHRKEQPVQCITEIAGKDVAIDGHGVHLYDRRTGKRI